MENPLANWMEKLGDKIQNKELIRVAIPGSHDSGSYGIKATSKDAPDIPNIVKKIDSWAGPKGFIILTRLVGITIADTLYILFKAFRNAIIAKWAKSQELSIAQQLNRGIRYFDLRVVQKSLNKFFIVHAKYSVNIDKVLEEVAIFAKANPKEIILLDFNHLYNIGDHGFLVAKIRTALGAFMAPRSMTVNAKVNDFWENNKQIIVFYDDPSTVLGYPDLWSEDSIVSPDPEKSNISDLIQFLDSNLPNNRKTFFVSQGILKPDEQMVIDGEKPKGTAPSSLLKTSIIVNAHLISTVFPKWENMNINIVIVDGVGLSPQFATSIIDLN